MTKEFVCTKCGIVDLISLAYPNGKPNDGSGLTCTKCNTGQWHDLFEPETPATRKPMFSDDTDADGDDEKVGFGFD